MIIVAMRFFAVLLVCFVITAISSRAQALTDERGLMAEFETAVPFAELNSAADDFGPSWDGSKSRVAFTTVRNGTSEVWLCKADGSETHRADGTFNAKGRHRAYVSFGRADEAVGVAFVRGERQSYPTIVTVPIDNGSLNEGHQIATLQSDGFTSQPTLSPDGTRLVFVSDRPGGLGGLDLWICDRRGQLDWSEPVLLSAIVNSPGDEITPSFITNDSLVYASNGYGGKGGFDLFLIVSREGAWQEPEPITWLNTEFDESDLAILGNGSLVFASDRPGGLGGLDLWLVKRK